MLIFDKYHIVVLLYIYFGLEPKQMKMVLMKAESRRNSVPVALMEFKAGAACRCLAAAII